MANNISDMMNKFSDMMGNSDSGNSNNSSGPSIDMETILKLKGVMEQMNRRDTPDSNLLASLKPYLKESRKNKVDQYISLLNMSKAMNLFGNFRWW